MIEHYYDDSLMHNMLAFRLGYCAGQEWAPASVKGELYFNGVYYGAVTLCDKIAVAPHKVNIAKSTATTPPADTSYLIEKDNYAQQEAAAGNAMFTESVYGGEYTFKAPDGEDVTPAQVAYIKGKLENLFTVTQSAGFANPTTGYRSLCDVASFIGYGLVQDLAKNMDSYRGSWFFTLEPSGKFKAQPLWDLDLAFGVLTVESWTGVPTDFSVAEDAYVFNRAPYYARMLQDPSFVAELEQTFVTMLPKLHRLLTDFRLYKTKFLASGAPQRNATAWPKPTGRSPEEGLDHLDDFLTRRFFWQNRRLYDVIPAKAVN